MLLLPGFPARFIEVEAAAKDKRVDVGTVSMLLAGPSVGDQVWGPSGYHGAKFSFFLVGIFLVGKPSCL